ncbi:MAG TPA: M20/M25/M40 family metallo-hydrolase [Terriglobales bacterium]|nr:M20/M25/M40 family metallo-hydrolase [Terriglobales bacterium]
MSRRTVALLLLLMPVTLNTRAFAQTENAQVSRIAQMRPVHDAFAWFRSHENELRKVQMDLLRVPAPPFGEAKRAEWLRDRFVQLGLQEVEIDKVGNVTGLRRGSDPKAKLLALTAHIDTVFPAGTPLNPKLEGNKIIGPGASDNGAGLIGLYAVASALKAFPLKHTGGILFVGNVGEEGEGDLRGMRHLFKDSKWASRIGPTVVIDGSGTDTVVTQALGSRRFNVTIKGPGGHSWSDYGMPNPIVILSRAIAQFTASPVPTDPRTSLNIGVIEGGTSVNSIPDLARMRVDIRSASTAEIDRLEKALRDAVADAVRTQPTARTKKQSVTYDIQEIGERPAADLKADARILNVIRAVDTLLSLPSETRRASTDANIPLSLGREAISIGAGGSGGGAHSLNEWFDATGRDLGLKRIYLTTLTLIGVSE